MNAKPMTLIAFVLCMVGHAEANAQTWTYISSTLLAVPAGEVRVGFDPSKTFNVELLANSPVGEASIREHSIAWHPAKRKYYLVADVVPIDSPRHPNTYGTELHLWSSPDLAEWSYHGIAVRKGVAGKTYDGRGVASPAGMVYFGGKLFVSFSARKTAGFAERGVGLAYSGPDPETLPWTKTSKAVSDIANSEDDDPALVVIPGDERLHLYHRRTGEGGYRIAHTTSATPEVPGSWPPAVDATQRPNAVRAQELTGAACVGKSVHLFIIEHMKRGGMRIAHLVSADPNGPFEPAHANQRHLPATAQPGGIIYSGHITPVVRDGRLVAFFWTARQSNNRYGLLGHPIRKGE